ncbi:hypothetical protein HBA54_13430 [Pelagibius litoralis]|uniref:Lipoprotein n=1 Tax=Pelagibius litoralis TaxID=374515 RepID=A0A967K914_9PROT|nr:hypothetical protein [Pelagibius litoralis]NIA69597.1 hypothetical protein [Pelagibius litoralis]
MLVQPRRRLFSSITIASAGLLMLAACASDPVVLGGESSGAAPPPGSQDSGAAGGNALPPPGADGGEQSAGLPAVPSQDQAGGEAAAEEEGVILKGPDGTTWTIQSDKDEEAYRIDIEDCYNYAWAQTRRDAQITDDRNAGIDTLTSSSRYAGLRQRVDEFDLRQRRGSLMTGCMEAKGYARSDTVLPRLEF